MTEKSIFKLCSPTLTTLTNVLMQSNTKSWSAVTSDDDRAIFSSIYLILTKLWRNQLTRSSTQTASTIFDNSNNEGWSADTHNYDRTIFSTASFILTKLWPKNECPRGHRRFCDTSNNESWSAVSAHEASFICDVVALMPIRHQSRHRRFI